MAALTLLQAEAARDAALSALTAALSVKESQMTGPGGGRKTVRHDIEQLQAVFDRWDTECKRLSRRGGMRFVQVVPCG